jgi:hypothetical protein
LPEGLSGRSSSYGRRRRKTVHRRETGASIFVDNQLLDQLLDPGRITSSGNEQGLLSLAFPPDYARKFFFVNYTNRNGDTVNLYEVTDDPNIAAPGNEHQVMDWINPHQPT